MTLKREFAKVAEIELSYKGNYMPSEKPVIKTARDAYHLFRETWDESKLELQEQFRIMLLDRDNSVLGVSTLSSGGMTECLADARLIFVTALLSKATGIIIAHNHPSGKKLFSEPDKKLTEKIVLAGKVLDIPVLDHILVTKDGYLSMSDTGQLPMPQMTYKNVLALF